jgi:hypothetical protein
MSPRHNSAYASHMYPAPRNDRRSTVRTGVGVSDEEPGFAYWLWHTRLPQPSRKPLRHRDVAVRLMLKNANKSTAPVRVSMHRRP